MLSKDNNMIIKQFQLLKLPEFLMSKGIENLHDILYQ